MPVPIEEMREHQLPLDERILKFLRTVPDKAFSIFEIVEAAEGYSASIWMAYVLASNQKLIAAYELALAALNMQGLVDVAQIRGQMYYAAR